MTIGEVSKALNISVRTLHYYDEIGLLKPALVKANKHRLYTKEEVNKLQQILIFRAFGMTLSDIAKVFNDALYDSNLVLKSQKQMLILKRNRLNYLIDQIDQIEQGKSETLDLTESEWELNWDEVYQTQGEVQKDVLDTVKEFVNILKQKGCKKVLDLGCGTGRNSIYMLSLGFEVVATDISEKGLKITKQKAKNRGFNIQTMRHDFREIPYSEDAFDAVLCSWVAGHGMYADMVKHAREMIRVVKKGGMIFVDYPSTEDEHYGCGEEIEHNTFVGGMPGEELMPHHYTNKKEIECVFEGYECSIRPYTYYYYDGEKQCSIEAFVVVVNK